MKIKNPNKLRQLYAEKCQWYTQGEIAKGLRVAPNTVNSALLGKPLYPATVKKFAEALGVEPLDIAVMVN